MSGAFAVVGWMSIVGVFFIPAAIIACVMLQSFVRGLILAAAFTAGALPGFGAVGTLGLLLVQAHTFEPTRTAVALAVATLGAIAGGLVAVWILSRFTKYPPWRRY